MHSHTKVKRSPLRFMSLSILLVALLAHAGAPFAAAQSPVEAVNKNARPATTGSTHMNVEPTERQALDAISQARANCKLNNERMSIGLAAALLDLADVYDRTNRKKEARDLLTDIATEVEMMEADKPQKIASPGAFDRLAVFLNENGEQALAEKWWQKVTTLRASAHAYPAQALAFRHYATVLKSQNRPTEATALEKRAKDLLRTVQQLRGLDY